MIRPTSARFIPHYFLPRAGTQHGLDFQRIPHVNDCLHGHISAQHGGAASLVYGREHMAVTLLPMGVPFRLKTSFGRRSRLPERRKQTRLREDWPAPFRHASQRRPNVDDMVETSHLISSASRSTPLRAKAGGYDSRAIRVRPIRFAA